MAYIYRFEELARERIEDLLPDMPNHEQEIYIGKLVLALQESFSKFLSELADDMSQQAVDEQDDC